MSREFYATIQLYHQQTAKDFAAAKSPAKRHIEVRIDDFIYVYLHEDGVHIQTQHVDIPERWWKSWPSDATVRRYIRRQAEIGAARITTLDA